MQSQTRIVLPLRDETKNSRALDVRTIGLSTTFGGISAFVHKLSTATVRLGGQPFSRMPGRPIRGYLTFPQPMIDDPNTLRPWLDRAVAHVLAMPPKGGRQDRPRVWSNPRPRSILRP